MIAYELIKKKPDSAPVRHIREIVRAVKDGIVNGFNVDPMAGYPGHDAARLANQQALAEGEKPPWLPAGAIHRQDGVPPVSAVGMGKLGYATWLNEFVYPKFKKGTLVTLRQTPFIPSRYPVWWSEVTEIQEVHYMADIDRHTRDPKAVGLRHTDSNFNGPVWYPPAALRPLNPEEINLIDYVRNPAETVGGDGTEKADPASSS